MSDQRTGSDAKPTAPTWLAVLASTIVTLVVLELAVRTYTYMRGMGFSESPYSFISPFFTTEEVPAPRLVKGTFVFKEGERADETKPPGEIRVVCIGGSTTLPGRDAEGVSYPAELERLLRERFPGGPIKVFNAGGNGFSSAHSIVNFALRILEVDPDVVTIYDNVNDLSVNYFGDRATSDYGNKYLTPYYLGYRHRTGLWSTVERMSRLARLLTNRIQMLQFEHQDYDPKRDYRSGLSYFHRNLMTLVAIARAHHVGIVLMTQAARSSLREDAGFLEYNDQIRAVAHEMGVPLADVHRAVVDDSFFVDDVHNNSAGARAVAKQIVDVVAGEVARRLTEPAKEADPR